jgi:hypothetical protein
MRRWLDREMPARRFRSDQTSAGNLMMIPSTRNGFQLAPTMPQALYLSLTIGLVLIVPGFFIPIPGTFMVEPGSVVRPTPTAARCLRFDYESEGDAAYNPPYILLSPEPSRVYDREWAKGYRAQGWPANGIYTFAGWRAATGDSIDIGWHHSPVLRVPLPASRTDETFMGRGGIWYYASFFDLFLRSGHFNIRATEIDCPDPIPGWELMPPPRVR